MKKAPKGLSHGSLTDCPPAESRIAYIIGHMAHKVNRKKCAVWGGHGWHLAFALDLPDFVVLDTLDTAQAAFYIGKQSRHGARLSMPGEFGDGGW